MSDCVKPPGVQPVTGYTHYGCRCAGCTTANRIKTARYVILHRATVREQTRLRVQAWRERNKVAPVELRNTSGSRGVEGAAGGPAPSAIARNNKQRRTTVAYVHHPDMEKVGQDWDVWCPCGWEISGLGREQAEDEIDEHEKRNES